MYQFLFRAAARFAILIPGLVIAYWSVKDVFPFIDKRFPDVVSILVTYVLGAYIFIPALFRLLRVFRPSRHLPIYSVTPDGLASDPINVGIVGTRRELITVMEQAGWYVADRHSLQNVARMSLAIILGRPYDQAPVSSLYLFGRKQDIAFEIPVGDTPSTRHHVRFWATTFDEDAKQLDIQSIHWHHRRAHVFGDNLLWVGAASLDIGINFVRHNLQLTHMIDPDTDSEREMIVKQLRAQKFVSRVSYIKLDNPYHLLNRVINGYLRTDGRMAIINLKRQGRLLKLPPKQ